MERKICPACLESCEDVSRYFAVPGKRGDIFIILIRIGVLFCLVASVLLSLYSAFSKPTKWFPLPEHIHVKQNARDLDNEPTNMSHIQFGIGGSVNTWQERSHYTELWWDPNATRGFVWLDKKPKHDVSHPQSLVPYQISSGWRQFRYLHSDSEVRIARIVYESFKLGLPNVRWFVMGDDDTVFFTKNLVTVLGKYDHNEMYYIGGNSESVEQDVRHAYGMAFGGGGFAISYALAAQLANIFDTCLRRYFYFYGSDQRVWACVSEIGVHLTKESGFHQLDIRGDPHGFLAAHPLAPLVSLHHLDYLHPLFPNQSQIDSVKAIIDAYQVDPSRIMQQTFCYVPNRGWSISISWGYIVMIYPSLLPANDLQTPLQTFKTWRSYSDGPFTFNTRPLSSDPCQNPALYFLDHVEEFRTRGSITAYKRFVPEVAKCMTAGKHPVEVERITVSALKLEPDYWKKVPRRQCCQLLDGESIKDGNMRMRIRKCRPRETVSI